MKDKHTMRRESKNERDKYLETFNGKIDLEERTYYLDRLKKPYEKKGEKQCFIEQYQNGNGKELNKNCDGNFFSKKSSSRFAFELFSWMAENDEYLEFFFEKKLPGLKSSKRTTAGVPNMDVFYTTENTITFIESKFTEMVCNKKANLAEAYYLEKAKKSSGKGYWSNTIVERYGGYSDIAESMSSFIGDIINHLPEESNIKDWFDVEQEIRHLVGIALYCAKTTGEKSIKFFNVIHDFKDDRNSKIHDYFVAQANDMMSNLLKSYGVDSFEYKTMHHTEFLECIEFDPRTKAYGSDETVLDRLRTFCISEEK